MRAADFRSDINGLRGLSVALVVAYHLQFRGFAGGFIGVDVFFVISGYLMTRIVWGGMERGDFRYGAFVVARMRRIWPALAVLLLVLFAAGMLVLPPFDLEILARQAQWAALLVSNHFYAAEAGYNTATADNLWLLHTWSLAVEWQFYLLYPLLLLAAAKAPAAGRRRALWTALLVGAGASLLCQLLLLGPHGDASFFLLPARAWELLAGGLAFLLERDAPLPRRWRATACLAGVALVLGSALVIALWRLRPVGLGPWLLLPVAGAALVLWAGDAGNRLLGLAGLQHLGRWSYSLYLWHWPILLALRIAPDAVERPQWAMAAAVAASLLAGALSWRFVERPLLGRRAAGLRDAAAPGLLMACAWAGAIGLLLSQGLAIRDRDGDARYRAYRASVEALYFPEQCGNFKKQVEAMRVCAIDKGGAPRVLVIGDSHAEHLYAWFVAHSGVSVDFFVASECPPVPHFERLQPGYDCRNYARSAWEQAASGRYDTVVVSARWATVALAGPPYCHRTEGEGCVLPALSGKAALVRSELQAAMERVLAAGTQLVFVDGAPEARWRVPERVARERFWHGEVRASIPLQSLVDQTGWLEPLLQALSGRAGFHRVSLRERLCDATRCRVYDPAIERPIYVDNSHFDPVWLADNATLFAAFVRPPSE